MKQFKIITFIITLLSFTTSVAQTNYFSKFSEANRWSAGIQLSPNFAYNDAENIKIGFGGGVHAKYSFGQSFGSGTHWVFAALITAITPFFLDSNDGVFKDNPWPIFAFFAGFMVLQLLWVLIIMPETKGKSLEELQAELT